MNALRGNAAGGHSPNAIALEDGARCWSHVGMRVEVSHFAAKLRVQHTRVLATLMDNSPAWVMADAAAAEAGVLHVPLPLFFTAEQTAHALRSAGVDTVLTVPVLAGTWPDAPQEACQLAREQLALVRLPAMPPTVPPGTAKITFTSGTTGAPKGVCLSLQAMRQVAAGLVHAMDFLDIRRHLCVLPLAVLLENIAGVMAPLSRGAACIVPHLQDVGLSGSSGFDAARFHAAVVRHRPDSMILLPQMLRAWVGYLQRSHQSAPASLRMVAVGGAAVGERLIRAARTHGIPAYEGFGLSEGASVQTLNLPGADRPGTAGRPLPHARVRIAADGEIEIAGSLMSGYLGEAAAPPPWWPTGDMGALDADGFLHVHGRKKHVLITAFGRNVSPEWVETALRSQTAVAQAVVFGDAQPALSAVIWPATGGAGDAELQAAVKAANAALPDYARVHRWARARAAFSAQTGLATANGRPQRDAILQSHADALGIQAGTLSHERTS
jgi:long-subunit acyl-CoA synthetase (AMP-forming)